MTRQQYLLDEIHRVEDALSALVTKLWKVVQPEPDEEETAREVLASREDNWNPTDMEVLELVIEGRKGDT